MKSRSDLELDPAGSGDGLPPTIPGRGWEDLAGHPGHLIRRAQQALTLVWNQEVSTVITSPQFAVMNELMRAPDIDQRTLGERVALDRSTTAAVVERLTSRQLVRWTRATGDGRRKTIRLTPRGERALADLIPRTHRMTRRLVRGLTPAEEAELLRLLTAVVRQHERAAAPNGKASRRSPHLAGAPPPGPSPS